MRAFSSRCATIGILGVFACASRDTRPRPLPGGPEAQALPAGTATPERADAGPPGTAEVQPTTAQAPIDTAGPRITSVAQTTWIYRNAEISEHSYLGYIRSGTSVAVRSLDKTSGVGCPEGFYQALPRGFVCADHTVAVTPPEHYMRVIAETRPHKGPLPYRYALSDGAPMYNRVPTADEIRRAELFLGKPHEFTPLFPTLRAHEDLADSEPILGTHVLPSFLENGGATREPPFDLIQRTIPRGSMLSFEESFEARGRVYLLSTDHTIVPADRVRAYKPSTFHGTRIGDKDVRLPIAWVRKSPRPKYLKLDDGTAERTEETWPVRSSVELTGVDVVCGTRRYLETRESVNGKTVLILESDATVVNTRPERPFGVKAGQKWIDVSITQGTLVAYEDLRPVYATLISPGAGGVPIEGHDPVKDSTTPMGTFTITFKDRAATMSPMKSGDRSFWIADVPYTQYFDAPFALHAAFWHERFGEPTSAGCVNLAPIDAEELFSWTDPAVPDEWQGVTAAGAPENGPSTEVVIRR